MRGHTTHLMGIAGAVIVLTVTGCSNAGSAKPGDTAQMRQQGASLGDSASMIARNLMKFDTLDFVAFSHQQFDRFKESHAADITVTFPDGHETHGLPKHIDEWIMNGCSGTTRRT
jgi:hypothetical protein